MSASIHPPVQLHIVLDEDSYQGGDSVEMARRFTAVAPTEVVRAAKGSQRANVLRFDLGDDAVTAEADDDPLWRDALATWLDEEFAETSALVARENDARQNNGEQPVPFTWAEVKFGAGPVIAIRMKDSSIPPEAAGFVARARQLLAGGAFGADAIAAIWNRSCTRRRTVPKRRKSTGIPKRWTLRRARGGPTSCRARSRSAMRPRTASLPKPWPKRRPRCARALIPRTSPPRSAADADAGNVVASATKVEAAGHAKGDVDTSGEGCALEAGGVPEHLDYRVWNVAYADGTSVRFDSVLGEALLD